MRWSGLICGQLAALRVRIEELNVDSDPADDPQSSEG
jgi:hypothetical protein